jgi:hypothetical protein
MGGAAGRIDELDFKERTIVSWVGSFLSPTLLIHCPRESAENGLPKWRGTSRTLALSQPWHVDRGRMTAVTYEANEESEDSGRS